MKKAIDNRTPATKQMTAKEAIEATFVHYAYEVPPALVDDLHTILVATVRAHNDEANRLLAEMNTQVDEANEDLAACQLELVRARMLPSANGK